LDFIKVAVNRLLFQPIWTATASKKLGIMLRYTQWAQVVVVMSQNTPYPPLALAQVVLHSFDGVPPFQVATVIRKSQLGDKSKKE
jgi:hypothetical protein